MVKAYAIHAVQTLVEAGKVHEETGRIVRPAKTQLHQPGSVVELDDDAFEDLEAEGAVRKATREDVARAESRAETRPTTRRVTSEPGDGLDAMSRTDLDALAKERGLDVSAAKSKADVLAVIRAAQ